MRTSAVAQPTVRLPRLLALVTALLLALGWIVLGSPVAAADGPTTFSNSTSIAIPAVGSANQMGPGSPYPSGLTVTGMTGLVTKVTVTFHDLTHPTANDIDAMVVAPTGQRLVVFSDASNANSFSEATDATLTFDDDAASTVPNSPTGIPSGSYKPTNNNVGNADSFPAPAPAPTTQTTLSAAFTGIDPNGSWKLFTVDDNSGDVGTMAGGWSVTITTAANAVATTTALSSSDTTSFTSDPVTFTATVRAGAAAVTDGTVQFSRDGGTTIGTPVALNSAGVAALTTAALPEGTHTVVATYSGATGFLSSNADLTQRVDNRTVVTDRTYCNTGAVTGPGADRAFAGPATPYPSNIFVSGLAGQVTKVTASLKGLSHASPTDLDIMLAGPTPSKNLLLLSDPGQNNLSPAVNDLNLTFDDSAPGPPPNPLVSGTFKPIDLDPDGQVDTFPAPAPTPSSATTLSTFNGASANGTWSLWVVDDASGDEGQIANGWCVTITSQVPTATALTSSTNPSTVGQSVKFSATVYGRGQPRRPGLGAVHRRWLSLAGPCPRRPGRHGDTHDLGPDRRNPRHPGELHRRGRPRGQTSAAVNQVVNKIASTTTCRPARIRRTWGTA